MRTLTHEIAPGQAVTFGTETYVVTNINVQTDVSDLPGSFNSSMAKPSPHVKLTVEYMSLPEAMRSVETRQRKERMDYILDVTTERLINTFISTSSSLGVSGTTAVRKALADELLVFSEDVLANPYDGNDWRAVSTVSPKFGDVLTKTALITELKTLEEVDNETSEIAPGVWKEAIRRATALIQDRTL